MHKVGLVSLLAVGLVAVAACGDDDVAPSNAVTPAPDASTSVTPTPDASADATPAPTDPPPPAGDLESTKGRLLVGDGDPENPRMMVVDLDDGKVVASFATLGTPATYRAHAHSRFAYANQRVHDVVEIVDSGVSVDAHGHLVKGSPRILSERFEGEMPTHWVHHHDWIVSFNDGDGTFDYLLESTLESGRVLSRRATTGRAHHGVAVIANGNVFASFLDPNNPAATSPFGVTMRRLATPDTVVKQSEECPSLHGEGGNEETVAFGCSDGVLLAERKDGDFGFRKLANPAATPTGQRVGTVRMADGLPRIIGNWGQGLVVIDAKASPPTWTPAPFGAAALAFFITEDAKHVIALDGNGALRRLDALTGAELGTALPVVDAWAAPQLRPSLGLGDGVAFVADPRTGKVTEIDLATFTKGRTLDVGGKPTSVAAFAKMEAEHDHDHGHDAGATTPKPDGGTCRTEGACTRNDECCEECHVDHCH